MSAQIVGAPRRHLAQTAGLVLVSVLVGADSLALAAGGLLTLTTGALVGGPIGPRLVLAVLGATLCVCGACAGIATVATWRLAWGRGAVVDARDRVAMWVTGATTVAVLPSTAMMSSARVFNRMTAYEIAVVAAFTVVAGTVSFLAYRAVRGRARLLLVSLLLALVALPSLYTAVWQHELLADIRGSAPPTHSSDICTDGLLRCARTAAERTGLEVAVVPIPEGFTHPVVFGTESVGIQLRSTTDAEIINVLTAPPGREPCDPPECTRSRALRGGATLRWAPGRTVDIPVEIEWEHNGTAYVLSAFTPGGELRPSFVIDLWHQVHYVRP